MTEHVYTALYADGDRVAGSPHTSAEMSCCINTKGFVRLTNMAVIMSFRVPQAKHRTLRKSRRPEYTSQSVREQHKALKAHQMIDPLEKLLHIICQLSLMGESLFQVSLKHIADACRKACSSLPVALELLWNVMLRGKRLSMVACMHAGYL